MRARSPRPPIRGKQVSSRPKNQTQVICNLMDFIEAKLDSKLNSLQTLMNKNKKNLDMAKRNFDTVEKKVIAIGAQKCSSSGGLCEDIKAFFNLIKVQTNNVSPVQKPSDIHEKQKTTRSKTPQRSIQPSRPKSTLKTPTSRIKTKSTQPERSFTKRAAAAPSPTINKRRPNQVTREKPSPKPVKETEVSPRPAPPLNIPAHRLKQEQEEDLDDYLTSYYCFNESRRASFCRKRESASATIQDLHQQSIESYILREINAPLDNTSPEEEEDLPGDSPQARMEAREQPTFRARLSRECGGLSESHSLQIPDTDRLLQEDSHILTRMDSEEPLTQSTEKIRREMEMEKLEVAKMLESMMLSNTSVKESHEQVENIFKKYGFTESERKSMTTENTFEQSPERTIQIRKVQPEEKPKKTSHQASESIFNLNEDFESDKGNLVYGNSFGSKAFPKPALDVEPKKKKDKIEYLVFEEESSQIAMKNLEEPSQDEMITAYLKGVTKDCPQVGSSGSSPAYKLSLNQGGSFSQNNFLSFQNQDTVDEMSGLKLSMVEEEKSQSKDCQFFHYNKQSTQDESMVLRDLQQIMNHGSFNYNSFSAESPELFEGTQKKQASEQSKVESVGKKDSNHQISVAESDKENMKAQTLNLPKQKQDVCEKLFQNLKKQGNSNMDPDQFKKTLEALVSISHE